MLLSFVGKNNTTCDKSFNTHERNFVALRIRAKDTLSLDWMSRFIACILVSLAVCIALLSCAQPVQFPAVSRTATVVTGAEQSERYLPLLKKLKVAVVANPTSVVGGQHLIDHLVTNGIDVQVVFAPEHGFRGEAGNGDKVADGKDPQTGIRVVSLYGKRMKPLPEDLRNVQAVVFDVQDVGARFYTYISTLQYVMEACADAGIDVVVLDRPNPNGHYVDGPVMQPAFRSFVGMNPIPVVHGCTVGEYANMLIGEGWLKTEKSCRLTVVPMLNYTHDVPVAIGSRPSPNLTNMNAIRLYPSLCLFEGTHVSLGRGTDFPFEVYGYPQFPDRKFSFTPKEIPGVAAHPPYEDTLCYGEDLRLPKDSSYLENTSSFTLKWLLNAYRNYPDKDRFFNSFFNKLAGNSELQEQIKRGLSEDEIRKSWQSELTAYKLKRKKYLLYPDVE